MEGIMRPSDLTRQRVLRIAAAAFAALVFASGMLPARADTEGYMTVSDASIQGNGPNHTIELESFSWGSQATASQGGGSGSGRVRSQDLQVTRSVDVASPKLFAACASGQHFKTVSLTFRGATNTFDDVTIVSVQTTKTRPPLETLKLSYAGVETVNKTPVTTENHSMLMAPGMAPVKKP
jgi:type VI secretion system secreted protein Hcp